MKVRSDRAPFERCGVVIEPGENEVPDGVGALLLGLGLVQAAEPAAAVTPPTEGGAEDAGTPGEPVLLGRKHRRTGERE